MPLEIIVPRLGWSMEEGGFVAWLKKEGDQVQAGDPLFSIEGDKAVQEIESIDAGVLRIKPNGPKPGDPVRVGDVLGHLLTDSEAKSGPSQSALAPTPRPIAPPTPVSNAPSSLASPSTSLSTPVPGRAGERPLISPRALRRATELSVDWTSIRGSGRSGRIREQDVLAASNAAIPAAKPLLAGSPSSSPKTAEDRTPPMRHGMPVTVLVTGGCGFIGTWVLRELLQRKLRTVVLDATERPERWSRILGPEATSIPLIHANLLDRESLTHCLKEHQVTHVIHLAALLTPACQSDPYEGFQTNVLGTVALLEAIRATQGAVQGFSYASSVAVFGAEAGDAGAVNVNTDHPMTFYGAFKRSVELIAEQYSRHFGISSVGIRPQVAYGPEREVGLTAGPSLAARAAARGAVYCIGYTGRVGYDYVEDVARGFVRGALEAPQGAHVVDLTGEVDDVDTVIQSIIEAVPDAAGRLTCQGEPIPSHRPRQPRPIASLFADWKTTSLAEGMQRTVSFYLDGPA